jgi:hypothetical protein
MFMEVRNMSGWNYEEYLNKQIIKIENLKEKGYSVRAILDRNEFCSENIIGYSNSESVGERTSVAINSGNSNMSFIVSSCFACKFNLLGKQIRYVSYPGISFSNCSSSVLILI